MSPSPLEARADRVLCRVRRIDLVRQALYGFALLLLGLWLLVVADGLWPFAPWVRVPLGVLWLAGAVLALVFFVPMPLRRRRHRLQAAALLDHQLQLRAEPVATALSLEDQQDPLAQELRRRAADTADRASASARPASVVPLSRLSWQAVAVAGVVLLWVVTAAVFPMLPGRGILRYAFPLADVPPFSLTRFEVRWSPATPEAGDDVQVLAEAYGRVPDTVEAVMLDEEGRPIDRRALRGSGPGEYALELRGLREAVTFHLEAYGRRTRRYTITPRLPEPEIPEIDGDSGTLQPDETEQSGALRPGTGVDAPGAAVSGLMGRLAGLVSDLMALAEQARAAAADDPAAAAGLAEQWQALRDEAEALAEALRQASDASPAFAEQLDALAQALAGLEIAGLSAPADAADAGGDTSASPQRSAWAQALADAARNDAASLATGLGESLAEIESGLANLGGGDDENQAIRDPQASGGYDETLQDGDEGVLPEALMRQVPPRYRDQTSAYFRRLSEPRCPSNREDPP